VRKKKLEVIVEKTKMMVLVEKPSFSRMMFESMIKSILMYGAEIWG
jgi:hypothetical protein